MGNPFATRGNIMTQRGKASSQVHTVMGSNGLKVPCWALGDNRDKSPVGFPFYRYKNMGSSSACGGSGFVCVSPLCKSFV